MQHYISFRCTSRVHTAPQGHPQPLPSTHISLPEARPPCGPREFTALGSSSSRMLVDKFPCLHPHPSVGMTAVQSTLFPAAPQQGLWWGRGDTPLRAMQTFNAKELYRFTVKSTKSVSYFLNRNHTLCLWPTPHERRLLTYHIQISSMISGAFSISLGSKSSHSDGVPGSPSLAGTDQRPPAGQGPQLSWQAPSSLFAQQTSKPTSPILQVWIYSPETLTPLVLTALELCSSQEPPTGNKSAATSESENAPHLIP